MKWYDREFGLEIEVNTENGEIKRCEDNCIPPGMDKLGLIVNQAVNGKVSLSDWSYFHNCSQWIIKHDTSCGLEINSPVMQGFHDIVKVSRLIHHIKEYWKKCDERCSIHIHVGIHDLTKEQLARVLAFYIGAEHIILDAVPYNRKNNRFCRQIFTHENICYREEIQNGELLELFGSSKYYSCNIYHFYRGGLFKQSNNRRKTIEFRMLGNQVCLDNQECINWILFFLHFIRCSLDKKYSTLKTELIRQLISSTIAKKTQPIIMFSPEEFYDLVFARYDDMQHIKLWFYKKILDEYENNKYIYSSERFRLTLWNYERRKHSAEFARKVLENEGKLTVKKAC